MDERQPHRHKPTLLHRVRHRWSAWRRHGLPPWLVWALIIAGLGALAVYFAAR
jgi:hypothetical protein